MGLEKEILALFDEWNAAIQSGRPEEVVKLYAPDAVLIPTVSDAVRHNHEEIRDYFDQFIGFTPRGKIDEANIRVRGDIAVNAGLYTFEMESGPVKSVQARFTFVYQRFGDGWLIVQHHSSFMPEQRR